MTPAQSHDDRADNKEVTISRQLFTYQRPSHSRSVWQLVSTLAGYALLWYLAWYALGYSYWLSLPAVVLAAGFLVRLFIIFHDCGHGSFFRSKKANDLVGNFLGILTFTPYSYWHASHARHHATSANLDKRGHGDVWMMTVEEFKAAPWRTRLSYRLYRNPFIMFLLGPLFILLISHRIVRRKATRSQKWGVHLTNLALAGTIAAIGLLAGWKVVLLIQLPILYLAVVAGVWLFYVQHQFEGVYWARGKDWKFFTASLDGGSFYDLPRVLHWFTGNIGYHHIHHLNSRVPNYYLARCHEQVNELQPAPRITLWTSLKALRYRLWDEATEQLVGFGHTRAQES